MGNVTPKKTKFENDSPLIQIKTITLIFTEKGYPALEDPEEKDQGEEQKPRGQTPIL